MSLQRLRTDFRFAILMLFGAVAILGIGPFAAYRFLQGQVLAGVVDTSLVVAVMLCMLLAWRGGDIQRLSLVVVASMTVGCLLVAHLLGLPGALWSYPVITASFLLVGRTAALVASAVLVLGIILIDRGFDGGAGNAGYLASAGVACVLTYVFAHRTERQREELERLASRDPLTGVANRRAMEGELHIAAEAFRRHRVPVGIAVMDLDHFKRVNDELGHEAGDQVLVEFAGVVQSRCRAGDRLFRFGGEEFVLLLPGTGREDLHRLVDALRQDVASRLRAGDRPLTVSIGGAVLQAGEQTAEWLARADAAMYEAKRRGRDRVVVAAEVEPACPA